MTVCCRVIAAGYHCEVEVCSTGVGVVYVSLGPFFEGMVLGRFRVWNMGHEGGSMGVGMGLTASSVADVAAFQGSSVLVGGPLLMVDPVVGAVGRRGVRLSMTTQMLLAHEVYRCVVLGSGAWYVVGMVWDIAGPRERAVTLTVEGWRGDR